MIIACVVAIYCTPLHLILKTRERKEIEREKEKQREREREHSVFWLPSVLAWLKRFIAHSLWLKAACVSDMVMVVVIVVIVDRKRPPQPKRTTHLSITRRRALDAETTPLLSRALRQGQLAKWLI